MSPSYVYLLKLVVEHPGTGPSHLAEVLSLAPSTVTRFADALERKGFIERQSQGKMVELFPTEAGIAQMPAIQEGTQRMMDVFANSIGTDQAFDLAQTLSDTATTIEEGTV